MRVRVSVRVSVSVSVCLCDGLKEKKSFRDSEGFDSSGSSRLDFYMRKNKSLLHFDSMLSSCVAVALHSLGSPQ